MVSWNFLLYSCYHVTTQWQFMRHQLENPTTVVTTLIDTVTCRSTTFQGLWQQLSTWVARLKISGSESFTRWLVRSPCRRIWHRMMPYMVQDFGALYGAGLWSHIWHGTLEPYMVQDFEAVYSTGLWNHIQRRTLEPYMARDFGALYGAGLWSHIWCRTLKPYTAQDFGTIYSAGLWSRIQCRTLELYMAQDFGAVYTTGLWSHMAP